MGTWLGAMSPKLRYLIGHVSEVVEVRGQNIIIVTIRPL